MQSAEATDPSFIVQFVSVNEKYWKENQPPLSIMLGEKGDLRGSDFDLLERTPEALRKLFLDIKPVNGRKYLEVSIGNGKGLDMSIVIETISNFRSACKAEKAVTIFVGYRE